MEARVWESLPDFQAVAPTQRLVAQVEGLGQVAGTEGSVAEVEGSVAGSVYFLKNTYM